MGDCERRPFGLTPEGEAVDCFTLRRGALACEVLSWGAALRCLRVPDRSGRDLDVVLGYDTMEDYLRQTAYVGATVGRFANRIAGAAFELNGLRCVLPANEGKNQLHGGPRGFDKRLWTVTEAGADFVRLCYLSPDGEMGYPGTLRVSAEYRLTENALRIAYRAVSDRDTLCSLTNHAYFNLDGHASGRVERQRLRLCSSRWTPTDAESIPTGEIAPVEGTPMDLRTLRPIGARIDDDFPQLRRAGGYDHNFLIDGETGVLRRAVEARGAVSGVVLELWTDRPALQFYSGNFLGGGPTGKDGAVYGDRCGFALEPQCCPDAPHHPNFPGAFLPAGAEYRHCTELRFRTA